MIFYRISELMLPTLILRFDKNIISFREWETNLNFTGCQVPHFMIVLTAYINLLNLSWIKKCLFLRNMEPFNKVCIYSKTSMTRKRMARLPRLIQTRFRSLGNSSDSSRKQIFRDILGKFSFFIMNIYGVYLLKAPHQGDSYDYHSIPWLYRSKNISKLFICRLTLRYD